MDLERAGALINVADLNGLLRLVDDLCEARAWDDLLDLADRCHDALERGKQLWPIEAHIEYRVALEGPPSYAAEMLGSNLQRFMIGPLTEVVGSAHRWTAVADHIDEPQDRAYVAQERVLRGEDLTGDARIDDAILHVPLRLLEWEPNYAVATYRPDHVEVMEPFDPSLRYDLYEGGTHVPLEDPELTDALLEVVQAWTAHSNGAARVALVEGDAASAAHAIGPEDLTMARIGPPQGFRELAWAAASGGAHGARRGGAFGRFMSFYVGSLLCDLPWPCDPHELGRALTELEWFRWDEGEQERGWVLRLAIASPADGWSVAINATDLLEDGTEPRWLS